MGPNICPKAKINVILLNKLAVFSMPNVSAVSTAMIEGIAQTDIPKSEADIQSDDAGRFRAIIRFDIVCIKNTIDTVLYLPILSERIPKIGPESILKNPNNIQNDADKSVLTCHLSILASTKNVI